MKPPKTVRIGPAKWKIRLADLPELDDKLGLTMSRHSTIVIHENQSAAAMRDTVVHEILHAVLVDAGISIALGIDHDDEERMVRLLAPALLGVFFRDNPQLVTFLTA
jgi:hypothetical protein